MLDALDCEDTLLRYPKRSVGLLMLACHFGNDDRISLLAGQWA